MFIATELDRGNHVKVMGIAKRMKDEGITPDITTYNYLLQACAQLNLSLEARAVYDDMLSMGIQPNRQTFHYLMQVSLSCCGHLSLGGGMLANEGYRPFVVSCDYVEQHV